MIFGRFFFLNSCNLLPNTHLQLHLGQKPNSTIAISSFLNKSNSLLIPRITQIVFNVEDTPKRTPAQSSKNVVKEIAISELY